MSTASDTAPEDAPTDCNGVPHLYYSAESGPGCRVSVGKCIVCGEIDWADLAQQAAKIADRARAEERERIAAAIETLCPFPDDEHAGDHCPYREAADTARQMGAAPDTEEKPNA